MTETPFLDNYLNPVVERIFHDHYTAYELVRNLMGGYYANVVYNPNTKKETRSIIAKFQGLEDNNLNYYFALIFWDNLKAKNLQ
jgi:hypothetical protein